MHSPDILSLQEAASLLLLSPTTLQRYSRKGRVPARKVGRNWLFVRAELVAWLEKPSPASQPLNNAYLEALGRIPKFRRVGRGGHV